MTFVLVGHCGPDVFLLRNALQRADGDTDIAVVNHADALDTHVKGGDLLLVNRVLDGAFAHESGIELIRDVAARGGRALLVSNYDDAQQQAEAAGALPGFGKNALYDAETVERLRAALTR